MTISQAGPMTHVRVLLRKPRTSRRALLAGLVCGAVTLCAPAVASAGKVAGVPGWLVSSEAVPSTVAPGGEVVLVDHVANVGGAATDGSQVVVTDTLPAGMEALQAGEFDTPEGGLGNARWLCKGTAVVTCVNSPSGQPVIEPGAGFLPLAYLERGWKRRRSGFARG